MKFADLFADENREVLLELQLPAVQQHDKQPYQLLKVRLVQHYLPGSWKHDIHSNMYQLQPIVSQSQGHLVFRGTRWSVLQDTSLSSG